MRQRCRRLSLVPLCYLWQRSQKDLLLEMLDAGMNVVLIKVAGIGLTKHHLGKTLGEMKDTFFKLASSLKLSATHLLIMILERTLRITHMWRRR